MTTDTDTILAAIAAMRARADAATPGPWHVEHDIDYDFGEWRGIYGPIGSINDGTECELFSESDADFIAHARTDVPALADAAEALAQLRAIIDRGGYIDYDPVTEDWLCIGCGDSRPGHDPSCAVRAADAVLARLAEVAG